MGGSARAVGNDQLAGDHLSRPKHVRQESVAPEWRSITSAIATMGNTLGMAGPSIAGGYPIAARGYSGLFYLGAALMGGSALLVLSHIRLRPALAGAAER